MIVLVYSVRVSVCVKRLIQHKFSLIYCKFTEKFFEPIDASLNSSLESLDESLGSTLLDFIKLKIRQKCNQLE
jgi:hypothetical protein